MKKLIYTIICFKCILQITEGSPYQKYIKLFSHLLILCMCCGMLFSFKDSADKLYSDWQLQWEKITDIAIDEDSIKAGSEYYEEMLLDTYKEAETLEYEPATGEAQSNN